MDKSISFYGAEAEGFYHGLVLCLIALLDNQYKIRSNRESGDGRYDNCIFREESCYKNQIESNTKSGDRMLPVIDKKETGINLRRIMDKRGLSVKDIQQYLGLGSVQSVYHWLNGLSMPTVDNLYALSHLFQVSVDDMLCGDRPRILTDKNRAQIRRLCMYYEKINEIMAA